MLSASRHSIIVLLGLQLAACGGEEKSGAVAGSYSSSVGDVIVKVEEKKTTFSLLAVTEKGRIGEAAGELLMKGNVGRYSDEALECDLTFTFGKGSLAIAQVGTCSMGLGVIAEGSYSLKK